MKLWGQQISMFQKKYIYFFKSKAIFNKVTKILSHRCQHFVEFLQNLGSAELMLFEKAVLL